MYRTLLKSKVHRVSVTHDQLHCEGSCAIDEEILEVSGIAENEPVHVWNIANGERFVTYAVKAERGSGTVSVSGSAARRAAVGDLLIIAAFTQVQEEPVRQRKPRLVFVHDGAPQAYTHDHAPMQML